MRHASLRSFLIACTVLTAAPVLAQEAPPVVTPVPEAAPPPPVVVMGEDAETPAPTIEAIPAVWAPVPRDVHDQTAYGLYLAGRAALGRGEAERAADLLGQVATLTPEQPVIREQAFTAALLAGDLAVAARIGPMEADAAPIIREAGALVSVVQTLVSGDARAANEAMKARPIEAPHARAAALIRPWIAAAAGDWDTALAEPPAGNDLVTTAFIRFHRAELFEHRRQYDRAEEELQSLLALDFRLAGLFLSSYGEFLERRGRRDEALALYDTALQTTPTDAGVLAARQRIVERGRAPALMSLREGAARGLIVAAQQAASENSPSFAVVYLRLSLNIRPDPEVQFLLGQTLVRANLETASRAVMERVPSSHVPLYVASRMAIGMSLAKEGRGAEALEAYLSAAEVAPEDPRIAFITARQLIQLGRFQEGLALLEGPLLNTEDQAGSVRFSRGSVYEALGRIPEAEAELWAALQLEPDEPMYLNYLGYLWVDSGSRVAEGAAMIQRAHDADPEDGNIQDSLGWAQYRQGLFDDAVVNLEQAVAKRPANPTINDHLGDAYWQVGRRREAGFQWTRVLTLNPDDERRASVERKLEHGLDAGDGT